ncbi:uncharacterized protein KY384_007829 [Bacidia gigantensis]|uniref:uncharacterized protein n=1 Tax=Bacidia gigantensis TaxID=2732470 RepID=UPI001D05C116|nr:uncharacterized protein KY384_007829 [Bacidia gigantensis]KAG8527676.1 hypothetical protein KY384_007829 [Bacidia gigantensis]
MKGLLWHGWPLTLFFLTITADVANFQGSQRGIEFCQVPPDSWLGYGLDMRRTGGIDIFNWDSIENSISRFARVVKLSDERETQQLRYLTWDVPKGVDIIPDTGHADGESVTWINGIEARTNLAAGGSASASYKIVSGDASLDVGLDTKLEQDFQYSFAAYTAKELGASLSDYKQDVQTDMIKKDLAQFPEIDGTDKENLRRWDAFFSAYGSHVIKNTDYGYRFQFKVAASNTNTEVDKRFAADVGVTFSGLPVAGKGDVKAAGETQYSTFLSEEVLTLNLRGGDTTVGNTITADPTSKDTAANFAKWGEGGAAFPDIIGLGMVELWKLLREVFLFDEANKVQNAWNYFASHRADHFTKCTLIVNSDWGEFGLLTPGYVQDVVGNEGTTFSTSKIHWQLPAGQVKGRDVGNIQFTIKNDGSPITIYTNRGDESEIDFEIPDQQVTLVNKGDPDKTFANYKQWFNIPPNNQGVNEIVIPVEQTPGYEPPIAAQSSNSSAIPGRSGAANLPMSSAVNPALQGETVGPSLTPANTGKRWTA